MPLRLFTLKMPRSPREEKNRQIVYLLVTEKETQRIAAEMMDVPCVLVLVDDLDWARDLSPWPAPGVFHGQGDFSGGADAYLKKLTEHIVPEAEKTLGFSPSVRSVAGYSLAGLFAVYALYRTDLFARAASISGSLWYDGFLDFMAENRPVKIPEKVYFSLGDREKKVRNKRLAAVEDCTIRAEKCMRELGADSVFELDPGNHFIHVPERIAKGIRWLSA